MADIAPFRGLRFNPDKIDRLEDVVSPPYDVINRKVQAELLEKNPYNMIQLDITKDCDTTGDPEERYARARNFFEQWQSEGVLVRDETPAIYLYQIDYAHPSGRHLSRKGLVALVRLADFTEGVIKPHERTFGPVTEDRLKLMSNCHAQFSQIFSLYADEKGEIVSRLEAVRPGRPACTAYDGDGNVHTLWPVTDRDAQAAVQRLFQNKALYIADGHHRYTTALNFRNMARERGELTPDSPYNYTMMYLCGMEDPGLTVLPTHRLAKLPGRISVDDLTAKLGAGFHIEEMKNGGRESLLAEVMALMDERGNIGGGAAIRGALFGLYHAGEDRCFLLTLQAGCVEKILAGRRHPALRDLDVVVLSDLVLDHFLGVPAARCENENLISYFSDPDEALDVAVKESSNNEQTTPVLFLLNPTPVTQVRRVADASLSMPHKSTFFYPKVLTGLLLNKIIPTERVKTI